MKLKSKLIINSTLAMISVLIIGGIFVYSSNQSKLENQKNEVVDKISKNVLELNLLTNEHIQENSERTKEQWLLKYEENSQLLESNLLKKDESKMLKKMREEHGNMKEVFLQLSPENTDKLNKMISSRLSISMQAISSQSLQLSNILREKTNKTQDSLFFVIIFLSIVLVAGSFFVSYKIRSSILNPIKFVMQGTKEIERGNFRTRININTGDEIEELGNSFNKTMEALETIDLKRQELEHAKTEFLSVTSHELRSPMTPMRAQLQMLKDEYFGKLTPKQYTSIDIVLRNTERLDKIIMDLLEVSRIEAARLKFNFVKTGLGAHLRRTIEEMSGFLIEKNIQIIPKIEKIPEFECDPDRIMQVLRNLLENAIKFSDKNNRIIVNVKKTGDFILFSVKDFGIGITDKAKKRLFEPFYQGEETIYRKYGGTGLGLSICKGIVESQGGKIWFESKKGVGTEFFFTFPLTPVKEIKPIKLMFSPSAEGEYKILKILEEYLGPMAVKEIEILKKEELDYKNMIKYAKFLRDNKILNKSKYLEFESELREAFGVLVKPEVAKLMEIAKERKDMQKVIQKIVTIAYNIYGEIAIRKANTIEGLEVDNNGRIVSIKNDEKKTLSNLGSIYIDLMGDLSRFLKSKESLNNKQYVINQKR